MCEEVAGGTGPDDDLSAPPIAALYLGLPCRALKSFYLHRRGFPVGLRLREKRTTP
ncbi:hypothetical protein K9M06_01115 [Candidatus Bipolaricaulota bacterium]|nr:hypothetical protein [Candidatus Bipolaricaulota bacterium]